MNLEARLEGLVTTAELAGRADFELGQAVVSPSTRTLSGPGGSVDVEPRVMQVLVVLADAKGAVVTRETLFRRCWGSPLVFCAPSSSVRTLSAPPGASPTCRYRGTGPI